jgi:hypothetical protein
MMKNFEKDTHSLNEGATLILPEPKGFLPIFANLPQKNLKLPYL